MDKALVKILYIYGGGRWAKVILKVLSEINTSNYQIFIVTYYNKTIITKWLKEQKLEKKITVISDLPIKKKTVEEFFIIVNNAKSHYITIKKAISRKSKILFEKPIAYSIKEAEDLKELANNNSSTLYSANVFLFSEYLSAFKKLLLKGASIKAINFFWGDIKNEIRYADNKTFDSSVPIYIDVLPNISSFLLFLFPNHKLNIKNVNLLGDGSFFKINALMNDIKCKINLQRNGKKRIRILKIDYFDGDRIQLDFSSDKVYIIKNKKVIGSFQFNGALNNMLSQFLNGKKSSDLEDNFSIKYALSYLKIIEQIDKIYPKLQQNLLEKLVTKNFENEYKLKRSIYYIFSEIYQNNKKLSEINIKNGLNNFLKYRKIPSNLFKEKNYD